MRAHVRTLTHVDPLPCSALLAENINNPSTFVPRAAFFKVLIKHCSSCNKHSIQYELPQYETPLNHQKQPSYRDINKACERNAPRVIR